MSTPFAQIQNFFEKKKTIGIFLEKILAEFYSGNTLQDFDEFAVTELWFTPGSTLGDARRRRPTGQMDLFGAETKAIGLFKEKRVGRKSVERAHPDRSAA
ncbi:hypothetical protein [Caballeronia hypogeia]|uniref:hypothetical protein n=1 Tax=Caballeronia hypogeia TaxID=1777140 RepID=UPI0012FD963A|nr:hypothetical protein [Caballeronia hypogeia]